MKKNIYLFMAGILSLCVLSVQSYTLFDIDQGTNNNDRVSMISDTKGKASIPLVEKKVLDNGMTILVRAVHSIPKVSVQVWYAVGSKDEKTGEKGIAHLIEHMIFKGTEMLSESDINMLAQKLSASTNAFTSFDYTGYRFDLPTQNWKKILPVIADSMINAAFKDEHLNSEMKTVIQELKLYKDNFVRTLLFDMLTTIFPDHPYHYPIIGYKQDLWNVNGDDLKRFYKKHYVPNNATLVVVGDINPKEVFTLAEEYFGDIPGDPEYKRDETYHNKDIISKGVTLHRDVKQPVVALTYILPGLQEKNKHIAETLSRILGVGKASRLYKKLVNELKLVTSLEAFTFQLFDHSMFFIIFEPKNVEDAEKIIGLIDAEIDDIIENELTDKEVRRAIKQAKMQFYRTLESTQNQAYQLGQYYLVTGDENYIFNYLDKPFDELKEELVETLRDYFRPSVRHVGKILPLDESEKKYWKKLQQESDDLDHRFLSGRVRTSEVEPVRYADTINAEKPVAFSFPKAQSFVLDNGLKVLYYDTDNTPKIDIMVEFETKHYYDPIDKLGITNFVSKMLTEGTKNYTADELADELESRGITLSVGPGTIGMSMPEEEFAKGLELLNEVLTNETFDEEQIEKIRAQMLTAIKNFWDEPKIFSGQLIKNEIYKKHPYSKNPLGTAESIATMTRDDLMSYYKKYVTPHDTKMAIVGELNGYDVHKIVNKELGKWSGPPVQNISFPELDQTQKSVVNHPINRDQVVLALACLSVRRTHKDFDKLFIFDQILGSGVLGSMASKLFQLRERSGLFYTINGTFVANAQKEPGMFLVKTIVSLDRLKEAEKAITDLLKTVADDITQQEFEEAKRAILNASINNFESNAGIAGAMLFLERYNFSADYFDKRYEELEKITIDDVKNAVKQVLRPDELLTVRVGRVE